MLKTFFHRDMLPGVLGDGTGEAKCSVEVEIAGPAYDCDAATDIARGGGRDRAVYRERAARR
jgi:hypothetical protein